MYYGNKTYKYDELGRLQTKTETKKGFRPVTTYYKWNSQSQLVELHKQNQLVAEAPLQITQTEGNLALQAEGQQQILQVLQANWNDAIYWLYQEDDFTPTARYEKGQLHYTVADQIGTITELLTEDGYIDYRQKLNLWGEAEIDGHRHYAANDTNALKCNHRFVGQYYDEESGLHYNRFRYYSPETGQYLSHDPIGLLGGFNPYGYVGIPTAFVDPLGLEPSEELKQNYKNARARGMSPQDAYSAAKAGPVKPPPPLPGIDKGPWGERAAAKYLGKQGHQILGSVQNASGHGFDLVTRTRDGSIHVIEVKTSQSRWISKANMPGWVRDNIPKIQLNTNNRSPKNNSITSSRITPTLSPARKSAANGNMTRRSISLKYRTTTGA